jgi:hypothetical protein
MLGGIELLGARIDHVPQALAQADPRRRRCDLAGLIAISVRFW